MEQIDDSFQKLKLPISIEKTDQFPAEEVKADIDDYHKNACSISYYSFIIESLLAADSDDNNDNPTKFSGLNF